MNDPVETLSEGQKVCLRLVGRNMSSKEIALDTKFTPQTVDTYVKGAMAKLGVSSRREAARMLADYDVSQKSGSPSLTIVTDRPRVENDRAAERGAVERLIALPPVGGRRNDLNGAERVIAAFRVAVIGGTGMIALILLIAGVLKTFH